MTVKEVFEELYLLKYSKQRYLESRYAKQVLLNWKNHLEETFGGTEIHKVTIPEVDIWHSTLGPYAGNRSKSLLSQIFVHAQRRGYVPAGFNPTQIIPNHPERKRTRYASDSELRATVACLERDEAFHPQSVAFMWALILSGSRPSAIERITRDCIEFRTFDDQPVAVIQVRGKTGIDVLVFPPKLVPLLRELLPWAGSDPVFGKFPRRYWEKIRAEIGLNGLWARDWRRTVGTIGLSSGIDLGAIGALLNHKNLQTTTRYAKLSVEARISNTLKIAKEVERRAQ